MGLHGLDQRQHPSETSEEVDMCTVRGRMHLAVCRYLLV